MKLIVAGSRHFHENAITPLVEYLINRWSIEWPTEIVSGGANGVDRAGEEWQDQNWTSVGLRKFKADWNKHGKSAGPKRNKEMAEYGDELLLIWDGESKGSANMKEEMLKLKKPIHEVILKKHNVL